MLEEREITDRFDKFLHHYRDSINKATLEGAKSLLVDFQEMDRFDTQLADYMLTNPDKSFELMDECLSKLGIFEQGHARFIHLPKSSGLRVRDIRSKHIDRLITVDGIIRQATEVRPEITHSTFQCDDCGGTTDFIQEEITLKRPFRCILCGKKSKFTMISKEFVDIQKIVLEERPENLKGSEQPSRINTILRDDLVDPVLRDKLTPGNQVRVVGVMKEIPIVTTGGQETRRFDIMLMANSVETLVQEFEEVKVTPEEAVEIRKYAVDPDIVGKLVSSIAPSIYGHEKVKEAIALQLFGGVEKTREDGVRTRGDVHLLLVGDPGSAKTQLLKYVAALAPKGRYVSGKGSTAAGLTATVVKDEFLKGWALEAGALVLASGGIACVDELDKMGQEDRSAMHEALEQQVVSIAKANVQATLRAQCAVLGAANPKYGRFDPYQPVADQINMPDTLLSRFDLIFPIRDLPDPKKDALLAEHILMLHKDPKSMKPLLSIDFLRKYISYARRTSKPVLTLEAVQEIKTFFVGLRSKYSGEEMSAIPISPRQLEALVRMSEASAKMRMSNEATVDDARRAIDLLKFCLFQIGVDPETGKLDIDRLEGITTASKRGKIMNIIQLLKEMEDQYKGPVPKFELIERAKEKGVDEMTAERMIEEMKQKGDIYEPKSGFLQKL